MGFPTANVPIGGQPVPSTGSTDAAATSDSLMGEIYTLGMVAPPGTYRFKITVEDMNVARRGLVYQMKNKKRQGEVRGEIDMSEWLFRNPAVSGIEFAWNVQDRTAETPFGKGSFEVQPHPSAYYGYYKDMLSAYYEIYDLPPPPEGRRASSASSFSMPNRPSRS